MEMVQILISISLLILTLAFRIAVADKQTTNKIAFISSRVQAKTKQNKTLADTAIIRLHGKITATHHVYNRRNTRSLWIPNMSQYKTMTLELFPHYWPFVGGNHTRQRASNAALRCFPLMSEHCCTNNQVVSDFFRTLWWYGRQYCK